ncbi:hypothetical protein [Microviridae Fen7918_21]|uniref:hypothetical protein n=1 Tax=Microviridae Fen7918_21 TaxID=1655661 RepID=UPI00063D57E0|nr:hypothetical protein [Microviridae Fen7918_21]AKI26951.1 hypothetical protein [Microviridae Fen7918_21]
MTQINTYAQNATIWDLVAILASDLLTIAIIYFIKKHKKHGLQKNTWQAFLRSRP